VAFGATANYSEPDAVRNGVGQAIEQARETHAAQIEVVEVRDLLVQLFDLTRNSVYSACFFSSVSL